MWYNLDINLRRHKKMTGTDVTLKNEYLNVVINSLGAEIKSIKDSKDEERIHQSDMFWKGSAPVLFPICGRLYDGNLRINKRKYKLDPHGFARNSEFDIMEFTDDIAVFSLVSNEETKKVYPYDFELIITYKLLGKSIDVSYEVINDSKETMYFSIGAHEGYNCLSGLKNYVIEFENEETAIPYSDVECEIKLPEGAIKSFNLSDDLFTESKSIIFKKPTSGALWLKNIDGSEKVRVEYEGFDYLVLWTKPNTQFVCIEPWCGMGEFYGFPDDISNKEGIKAIEEGGQFEIHHIITID